MAPIRSFLASLLLAGTCLARNIPQADIELAKRDNVDNCKNILIALKASAFCSSFVPITDSTVTTTTTAPTTTVTTTITLPDCTTTVGTTTFTNTETTTVSAFATVTVTTAGSPPARKRDPSNQTTTPSTTKATTTASPSASATAVTTISTTAPAASCTIKGLPIPLLLFTCDVIKEACLIYVKPKTSTATSTVTPTATASVSTQPPCIPVTASATATTTTTVITTLTSTATSYLPTPSCNGNYATSNTGTRFCQFFAGYQVRNSFRYYTAQLYASSTSDIDAIQSCANFVSSSGSGVAQTFQVFFVPSENQWHCDTSVASNCDSNFQSNTYVNQIYQYNVIGSTCST